MVALPTASPTPTDAHLFPAFGRAYTHDPSSSLTSPGHSSPSSPSLSSSARFPCMDPDSDHVAVSSSAPIPFPSHQYSKIHRPSSSIPSPPEQYSTMQVKGSTAIDQPILPPKSALSKLGQEHNDYFDQHQKDHYRRDHNASSAQMDSKQPSRTMGIANLLNQDRDTEYQRRHRDHTEQTHRRPFTDDVDDQDVPSHHQNGNRPSYPSQSNGHRYSPQHASREPYGHRDMDTSSSPTSSSSAFRAPHSDRYSHSTSSSRPSSFSASASSASSVPSYSTSSSPNPTPYSSAPRSLHPGQQRPTWNAERYPEYNHSYEHERRNDRPKDYALHQQNYGPYLNPSSPPSHSQVHKSHSNEGSSYSKIPPTDSSNPLYYSAPPPSTSSSPSTPSSSTSYPYPNPSSNRATNGSSSSSSARSIHDYGHAPSGETGSGDQLRRQSHGPLPPLALLSENKLPRVYGRDSTVDDNWPPLPRATRVVPIDAPNEGRPILPPPYPSSSAKSAPSPSSSSTHRSYQPSYSNPPVEQKPRRVYGIDAADVPARLPPPAPSASYGSSQYSKPLQHIPDDEEGEARRRSVAQDSSGYSRPYGNGSTMSAPYGAQVYGYSGSSRYQSSEADRPKYDYDRGWKSNHPQSPPMPSSSTTSSTSRPAYTTSQPYSRPQSPDIQPPSWYQDYAHSVPPKSQSHSSYHSDSHYSSGGYNSGGYHGSDDMMEHDYEDDEHRLSNKRPSKSAMADGQSVHPFDTPEAKSKSKKPKRIKNPGHDEDLILLDNEVYAVKAKRKRANASQLSVLNAAFERSYFPSTEERLRLSKQCRMCPRTVQIWFQNKRQSVKAKSEAMEAAAAQAEGRRASVDKISSEGQKRTVDESDRRRSTGGAGTTASAEAIISLLDIQPDGRSVDYFSRKRRATIAKMEQNEQLKQKHQPLTEQPEDEEEDEEEQPAKQE